MNTWKGPLEKIDDCRWMIPRSFDPGMRVPGMIYASDELIEQVKSDQALQQVVNVAHLPGLAGPSIAMPDIHWGYGFPIGGVAAVHTDSGVISPGGVGYDINCGVRLIRTPFAAADIQKRVPELVREMFHTVPCGVGRGGSLDLSGRELERVLKDGAGWAVDRGYGTEHDLTFCEETGAMAGADPAALSSRALARGKPQLGTLGSGNHFLEIQKVVRVYDAGAAAAFGLFEGGITIMIHSGSRGLGYQVCDDSLALMVRAMRTYGISVPDQQLCCTPVTSIEGQQYFAAMACAANYAWANRQLITHQVREAFSRVLGPAGTSAGMELVYDVAHNIAKFEQHRVDEKTETLLVHRKGATRAFGPEHSELPGRYRPYGQPVLIPGDMGTASYVLAGTKGAMDETFGSCCHGAGRVKSRRAAVRGGGGRDVARELGARGISVMSRGRQTLLEEAPDAYKDIHMVVNAVHSAGLAKKVVQTVPLGVVKG